MDKYETENKWNNLGGGEVWDNHTNPFLQISKHIQRGKRTLPSFNY